MPAHILPQHTMSAKHTPGPWKAIDDGPGISIRPEGSDLLLAALSRNTWTYLDDGNDIEANARLIAAAPELLAVLKTTAGNIRSLGPAGALYSSYEAWLRVVDEAIEKAEGSR